MRARRKIKDNFTFAEGLSKLQTFFIRNTDWKNEISTFERNKDPNYRPAFIKDIMDKYSWGRDGIVEAYSDFEKSKLKLKLSSENLAVYIIHAEYVPWIKDIILELYNNEESNKKFNTESLSKEIIAALEAKDWDLVKHLVVNSLNEGDNPAAKEAKKRYLIQQAQHMVKYVRFKKKENEPGEVEADDDDMKKPLMMKPDAAEEIDNEETNELIDILDISNPMGFPYQNIGAAPADASTTFMAPGRPINEYPSMADPFRRPSPENFRMQWI